MAAAGLTPSDVMPEGAAPPRRKDWEVPYESLPITPQPSFTGLDWPDEPSTFAEVLRVAIDAGGSFGYYSYKTHEASRICPFTQFLWDVGWMVDYRYFVHGETAVCCDRVLHPRLLELKEDDVHWIDSMVYAIDDRMFFRTLFNKTKRRAVLLGNPRTPAYHPVLGGVGGKGGGLVKPDDPTFDIPFEMPSDHHSEESGEHAESAPGASET